MSKIRKVNDWVSNLEPLRITQRKSRQVSGRRRISARQWVRCGCCKEMVEIYFNDQPTGNPHLDSLEINGVNGSVFQWRHVLLPLLGMEVPKE